MFGRWLRERRVRRLRDRARTLGTADLADDVDTLRTAAVEGEGRRQTLAVEALSALARGGTAPRADGDESDASVADRAAAALVAALPATDDRLAADTLRTLRYVVDERPGAVAVGRLDEPLAALVDDWEHAAHGAVTLDAGALLGGTEPDLPATRAALWAALDGGTPAVREHAATAYLQVADRPDRLADPAAVADALRSVVQGRTAPLPPEGSVARTLAGGRTVSDAVRLLDPATDATGAGDHRR